MTEPVSHVIVIGGSSGLGKVVSHQYAQRGHHVSVLSRNKPDFVCESDQFRHFSVDLSGLTAKDAQLLADTVISASGPPRYLVFCQRYRGSEKNLGSEIAVSISATATIIDAFSGNFVPEGDKAVAVVSSVYGDHVGSSQPLDYHVAKAGLNALVRYYAVSLGGKGIRINAISPLTYLKEESKHVYLGDAAKLEQYRRLVPLRRMGTAEECASTISFLCSEQASFVTGQNLYVDGGVSVIWPEELIK